MGMFIGLFLFLVLLVCGTFYGVLRFKTLKKRLQQEYEQKTAKTEQQTQAILNHIDAGICTISRDFIIDPIYNNKILELFGQKEYGQTSIFDNIFYILEGDVKKELKEYLETIFDAPQASEEMLNSINPVSTFTYVFNESGKVIHKKIKTTTVRIFNENNNIQKVMFIFQDISLIDKLEQDQAKRERDLEEQFRKISVFLNNDREVLNQFLKELEIKIAELKSLLQKAFHAENPEEPLGQALRIAHSLKGESFTIGFQTLTDLLKAFEALVKKTKGNAISIETQLEAVMYFEKIDNERKSLLKLIDTIRGFSQEIQKPGETKSSNMDRKQLLQKELQHVCERSAAEEGKKISLDFVCELPELTESLYSQLKEVLLHLIRNSASHGIEDPISRLKEGKPETGKISCKIETPPSGDLVLVYEDDGRGFDIETIRKKALELGLISREKARDLKESEIISFIFLQGFSTKDGVTNVSGVGVGMAVVKEIMVKQLKSKISVSNRPGKGMTLRFIIPATSVQNVL
jgi:two-component system chemotaxis sensor kinase CheA